MTRRANEFLVWRAGSSVDWDCTHRELSVETGIPESTVQNICARKGWNTKTDGFRPNTHNRHGVDTIMNGSIAHGEA